MEFPNRVASDVNIVSSDSNINNNDASSFSAHSKNALQKMRILVKEQSMEREMMDIITQLSCAKNELSALENSADGFKRKSETKLQELTRALKTTQLKLQAANQKNATLKSCLHESQQREQELKSALKSQKEKVAKKVQETNQLSQERAEQASEISKLRKENMEVRAKLEKSQQQAKEAEDQLAALQQNSSEQREVFSSNCENLMREIVEDLSELHEEENDSTLLQQREEEIASLTESLLQMERVEQLNKRLLQKIETQRAHYENVVELLSSGQENSSMRRQEAPHLDRLKEILQSLEKNMEEKEEM